MSPAVYLAPAGTVDANGKELTAEARAELVAAIEAEGITVLDEMPELPEGREAAPIADPAELRRQLNTLHMSPQAMADLKASMEKPSRPRSAPVRASSKHHAARTAGAPQRVKRRRAKNKAARQARRRNR
jgi:hypothetical protein